MRKFLITTRMPICSTCRNRSSLRRPAEMATISLDAGPALEQSRMNPLCELLGTGDILLDVDVRNKDELLQRVSELLAKRHGLSSAFVLESLRAREALGSTALGYGVAIPHARIG